MTDLIPRVRRSHGPRRSDPNRDNIATKVYPGHQQSGLYLVVEDQIRVQSRAPLRPHDIGFRTYFRDVGICMLITRGSSLEQSVL